MAISKSCRNCESRQSFFEDDDMCMFSGYTCDSTRRDAKLCGPDYKGWQLRNGGIIRRFFRAIFIKDIPNDKR